MEETETTIPAAQNAPESEVTPETVADVAEGTETTVDED